MAPTYSPNTAVVVTGAGSGLGRATCLALAEVGRPVAAWDVNAEGATETATECARRYGVRAVSDVVDVAEKQSVERASTKAIAELGPIGGLVCAAAILRLGPIGVQTADEWRATLDVNVMGVVHVMEALLPQLRTAMPGSSIVVIASTEGIRGNPLIPAYTASKHAVLGIVRATSRSLGPDGIRINALCPGAMETPMLRGALGTIGPEAETAMLASIPLGRSADPSEVGRVARFLLSDDASYVHGAAIIVDGGATAG